VIAGAILAAVLVASIVAINIADHRHRARLTPEERAREDEDTRREMQIW
jgi:hypothetical protein